MVRAVIYEELAEQSGVSVPDPLDALTLAVAALATGPFPLPLLEATQVLPAIGSGRCRPPTQQPGGLAEAPTQVLPVVDIEATHRLQPVDLDATQALDLEAFGTGALGIDDTQVLPVVRLEAMPPDTAHGSGRYA